MTTYASVSDIQARNPYRTIDTDTSPSTVQVESWIGEAEAMLHSALRAVGCTVPISGAEGILIMRAWVADYAAALVRIAYAASGGDDQNKDGREEYNRFVARIDDIYANPSRYQSILQGTAGGDGNTRSVRGYVLDNNDGKSIADGDFDPEFVKGEWWS